MSDTVNDTVNDTVTTDKPLWPDEKIQAYAWNASTAWEARHLSEAMKKVRDDYGPELATLRQAARALWSALHERQECAVCGGEGWHWVDSMRLPCACQITAERALDNWEELAKGGGDV